MPIPGPTVETHGTVGQLRTAGGVIIGQLTDWELVISPTTGMPTLKGNGHMRRWWVHFPPTLLRATVQPARTPYRLGRPRPTTVPPFTLQGMVARLTATAVTIAQGIYV